MARDRLRQMQAGQGGYSPSPNSYQQGYPDTQQPQAMPRQQQSYQSQNAMYGQQGAPRSNAGLPTGPRSGGQAGRLPQGSMPAPTNMQQAGEQGTYYSNGNSMPGQGGQDTAIDMGQQYPQQQQAPVDEESKFFNDINDLRNAIQDLNQNISRVEQLHQRQLDTVANDERHSEIMQQLDHLSQETRQLSNSLKNAIKRLEAQTAKRDPRDPNTNVRRTQVGAIKNRFMETIQRYQQIEQDSRKKHRQKMERQFKIVKPDATQQEVNEALDNSGQGNRIFEQALLTSNRYGDARAAYKEVQDRHVEILKIEQTITELAQMFNDMAIMVEEQDAGIQAVEARAQEAETNMQQAEGQMQKAVKSARAARRKRWICFIIIIIILAIVGIVVGIEVGKKQN